jgi:hypothetical protein
MNHRHEDEPIAIVALVRNEIDGCPGLGFDSIVSSIGLCAFPEGDMHRISAEAEQHCDEHVGDFTRGEMVKVVEAARARGEVFRDPVDLVNHERRKRTS